MIGLGESGDSPSSVVVRTDILTSCIINIIACDKIQ